MRYKKKKIYLRTDKSRYCWLRLYGDKSEMQEDYKLMGHDKQDTDNVEGAHVPYYRLMINVEEGTETLKDETGTIFIHFANCGAGVVTHEILHAVLFAFKHSLETDQYPIVINNMEEEEELLHNHTYATIQFYQWYWRIEKLFLKI